MNQTFILGLDLGQAVDHSALCVLEIVPPPPIQMVNPWTGSITDEPSKERPALQVRHLERWPLGTRYTAIVRAVGDRKRALTSGDHRPTLVVDKTGVGAGVVEMFADAGLEPVALTITSGGSWSWVDGGVHVAKVELVSAVQATLQSGRLRFAASLPYLDTLQAELMNFHYKITPSANVTYEAWRESIHDDLILAVSMAVWYAEKVYTPPWSKDAFTVLSSGRAI